MPEKFWHVFNYLSRQWYELEVGRVPDGERHYQRAMDFLLLKAAEEATASLGRE